MGKKGSLYYCDYCDVYLTRGSAADRKDHNRGRKHVSNVEAWYNKLIYDPVQEMIDEILRKHEVVALTRAEQYHRAQSQYSSPNPMMPPEEQRASKMQKLRHSS